MTGFVYWIALIEPTVVNGQAEDASYLLDALQKVRNGKHLTEGGEECYWVVPLNMIQTPNLKVTKQTILSPTEKTQMYAEIKLLVDLLTFTLHGHTF